MKPKSAVIPFYTFLILYSFLTLYLTAQNLAPTVDEETYSRAGYSYWETGDFTQQFDHPPLTKWIGASLAYLIHSKELIDYRLMQICIFLALASVLFLLLRDKAGSRESSVFSLLLLFCPNFKAMAALMTTDLLPPLLLAIAFLLLYFLPKENPRLHQIAIIGSILGLSFSSRLNTLFFFPFALYEIINFPQATWRNKLLAFSTLIAAAAMGIFGSYWFQFPQIKTIATGFNFQIHHIFHGQNSFLYGNLSPNGFWYYYLAHFLVKNTPIHLIAITLGLAIALKGIPNANSKQGIVLRVFFLPAILFFAFLSALSLQTGYRYFLCGQILLFLGASLILGPMIPRNIEKRLIFGFSIVLTLLDFTTWKTDSYLSYVNAFAPWPPSRNFADSNLDWHQGIPKHQFSKFTHAHSISPIPLFNLLETVEPKQFTIGASSLMGVYEESYAPLFSAFKPQTYLSGNEIFTLNRKELFLLAETILENQTEKISRAAIVSLQKKLIAYRFCDLKFLPVSKAWERKWRFPQTSNYILTFDAQEEMSLDTSEFLDAKNSAQINSSFPYTILFRESRNQPWPFGPVNSKKMLLTYLVCPAGIASSKPL